MMQKKLTAERISGNKKSGRFFLQWEFILFYILIGVNIMNSFLSPHYFSGMMGQMSDILGKSFIVFPMTFIILLGDIDISVASTAALSAVMMGVAFQAGFPMPLALLVCLGVGSLCGFINGWLLIKFKEISAVIVTLATISIYRGIA